MITWDQFKQEAIQLSKVFPEWTWKVDPKEPVVVKRYTKKNQHLTESIAGSQGIWILSSNALSKESNNHTRG
jgi:hypothetical protein